VAPKIEVMSGSAQRGGAMITVVSAITRCWQDLIYVYLEFISKTKLLFFAGVISTQVLPVKPDGHVGK